MLPCHQKFSLFSLFFWSDSIFSFDALGVELEIFAFIFVLISAKTLSGSFDLFIRSWLACPEAWTACNFRLDGYGMMKVNLYLY